MGSELMLDENWRETWAWALASTPEWFPRLLGLIGVGLAVYGLWKIASSGAGRGGKGVGIGAMVLFAVIALAPGPVISVMLRLAEVVISLFTSLVGHFTA